MKPQPFQVSDGADQRRFRSGADSHTTHFDAVGWRPCCWRSGQGAEQKSVPRAPLQRKEEK